MVIRDYYQKLYPNEMDNLEEMDEYSEKYNLPKLNQEETDNLNRPITNMESKTVIKNLLTTRKNKFRTRWLIHPHGYPGHLDKTRKGVQSGGWFGEEGEDGWEQWLQEKGCGHRRDNGLTRTSGSVNGQEDLA